LAAAGVRGPDVDPRGVGMLILVEDGSKFIWRGFGVG